MRHIKNHFVLFWGKMRRMYFVYLKPKHTKAQLNARQGECKRCGACCKININCPALDHHNGTILCLLYDRRSRVCSSFPLDHRDLKDRDLVLPGTTCGYKFDKKRHQV
jgi:hypothetical protein